MYDLLLLAILTFPLPPSTEMGAIEFIHGFGDLVQHQGDIPAIKAWGEKVGRDPSFEEREKLPRFIRDYGEPEWIDQAPDKSIRVMWGGGFMHWGLIVTAPGAEPPKSDDSVHIERLDNELYSLVSIR